MIEMEETSHHDLLCKPTERRYKETNGGNEKINSHKNIIVNVQQNDIAVAMMILMTLLNRAYLRQIDFLNKHLFLPLFRTERQVQCIF